ncbi:hypothetical protein HYW41_00775 [Candidatus Daviesbacteria bacterium]|nr:hypothetical protein [Candidatus Daviesbacteria bacterium]
MNRIIFLILIPVVILVLLIIVLSFPGPKKSVNKLPIPIFNPSPTNRPVSQLPATPLFITQVIPEDNSTNIPSNQQVQIIFNRALILDEVYISFGPGVIFKTAVNNNTIVLIPSPSLTNGLTYKLLVKFNKTEELSKQYQFTVAGTPPASLPDTQPPGAAKQSEEFNRQNHPDIFLANKTPIRGSLFDLYKGVLKSAPQEHYSFVLVTKTDQPAARNELSTILIQLGLNQDQINSLDIATISQDQFAKVSSLKEKLPFYSSDASISYDMSFDKMTIHIDQKNKTAGEQQITDFLKQNEIESTNWINNLSISYQ